MPQVSVLMGIYNCADTLKEAVDSIINQTFTDWELIMCDDCSTDNTYAIAQEIAEKDSRIKVIKNETNLTLAPTLNRCLAAASGIYVARMDGDDVCDPSRFSKELRVLESDASYAVVSCQMNLFDSEGIYRVVSHPDLPTPADLVKRSQFCHAGCMMRKDVLESVGGYSESMHYKRVEDYDLWARIYKAGYIGFNIQEPLYSMRDDRKALSRRTFDNRKNEIRVKRNIIKWFNLSKRNYFYLLVTAVKAIMPSFIYKMAHKS
jgi:glycosyltransferase EpsE